MIFDVIDFPYKFACDMADLIDEVLTAPVVKKQHNHQL